MNPSQEREKRFQVSRNLGQLPSLGAISPVHLGIINLFNKTKAQVIDTLSYFLSLQTLVSLIRPSVFADWCPLKLDA